MENSVKKIAIACQGGGTHAAFEVGVLTEILKDMQERKRFDLVGLSGTSAGALCAMMVWYGLAPKKTAGERFRRGSHRNNQCLLGRVQRQHFGRDRAQCFFGDDT